MLKALYKMFHKLLEWFATGGVASMMTHAGLALVVYSGMDLLILEFLDSAVSNINSVSGAVAQLALLCGIGEFISIIGSALLTKMALMTAISSVGLTYKG
jgi:hypothetical protein